MLKNRTGTEIYAKRYMFCMIADWRAATVPCNFIRQFFNVLAQFREIAGFRTSQSKLTRLERSFTIHDLGLSPFRI